MATKKNNFAVNTGSVYASTLAQAVAEPEKPRVDIPAVAVERAEQLMAKNDYMETLFPPERKTYTPEEAAYYLETSSTMGRKGLKMPRINIAFPPSLHDFLKTMARMQGISMTEYINKILAQYAAEHGEQYEKALELRESLK